MPDEPVKKPDEPVKKDTSSTKDKGAYWHAHGAGMAKHEVVVMKRYKHTFYDTDGNPDPAEVVDLAKPGASEPFVTCCRIGDKPGDGVFIPA